MFYVDDDFFINVDKLENGFYRIKKTYKKTNSKTYMSFNESQADFVARQLRELLEKED
ncbi:hypothetical protein HWN40_07495 [Methanolobus zinderi]|jgi:hypothetical protein|uniref:Uncharacterized protein n=1 Tax=Methanolobus zinderi TaxID=536044 RepID=A0A7D5EF32_9EURY|nr:hypothetical protein [Methanolobus zinderi]QLC50094.1 hypothetical protein HWN40_07495 [Methanolobus zinderi]